jgi:16S rRNA (adenine(1408)-N(1))-methyltransferase
VTIDVGTGDGRAVLAAAAAEPTTLVLGLDADAASMVEASRRAARPFRRGGLPNARFIVATAEHPPEPLRAAGHLVTVRFPWGSLLRGCLGLDVSVAAGVGELVTIGGTLELTLAPALHDGLDRLPVEPDEVDAAAAGAFGPIGLQLVEARPATEVEIGTTWGRRLLRGGGRGRPGGERQPVGERQPRTLRFRAS